MLRRVLIGISGALLSLSLGALFLSFVITSTLRPNNVKSWLSESGVYAEVPKNLIAELQKQQSSNAAGFAANNPLVLQAVQKIVTTEFVQQSTEAIVDGTFRWVDKELPQPKFNVDVVRTKRAIADNVVALLKQRYEDLPSCGRSLPRSTDPFTIECRPIVSFNIDTELERLKTQFVSDEGLLGAQNINPNTITAQTNGKAQPLFDYYKQIPDQYQRLKQIPIIAGIAALVFAALLVFASTDHIRGLRKIGIALLASGLLASIGLLVLHLGVGQAKTQLIQTSGLSDAYQASAVKIAEAAKSDLVSRGLWVIGSYILLGAIIVVGTLVHSRYFASRLKTMPPAKPTKL